MCLWCSQTPLIIPNHPLYWSHNNVTSNVHPTNWYCPNKCYGFLCNQKLPHPMLNSTQLDMNTHSQPLTPWQQLLSTLTTLPSNKWLSFQTLPPNLKLICNSKEPIYKTKNWSKSWSQALSWNLTDAVVFQLKIHWSLLVQTSYSKMFDDHLSNCSSVQFLWVPFFKGGQH